MEMDTGLHNSVTGSRREERFEFGLNWTRFLDSVDQSRIYAAVAAISASLGTSSLAGLKFLDIGCGSGLSSLAARSMGAEVRSFDYDPASVACSKELRRRWRPDDDQWVIEQGSALDEGYLRSLGQFDIVYSWGVLHHTGEMWKALANATIPVRPSGKLLVAIYNDQGYISGYWKRLKAFHARSGKFGKFVAELLTLMITWGRRIPIDLIALKATRTIKDWREYGAQRGMSPWVDVVDWAGGYPFEVAKPEDIFEFYNQRGFRLDRMKTCGGGKGCNEFVLCRTELK